MCVSHLPEKQMSDLGKMCIVCVCLSLVFEFSFCSIGAPLEIYCAYRGSTRENLSDCLGFLCICWVSYWVCMVHYWFEMDYECLGMVSNAILDSFWNFQISSKFGILIPYLLQAYFKNTRKYGSISNNIISCKSDDLKS